MCMPGQYRMTIWYTTNLLQVDSYVNKNQYKHNSV